MDKMWNYLLVRPQWVTLLVLLALALLPVSIWLDLRHMSDQALRIQANSLSTIINDIRGYYANNVVGRMLNNPETARALHNYRDVPGAIPIPATLSIEIGEVIGAKQGNVGYRFLSDLAFVNRVPHALDGFEQRALNEFRRKDQPPELRFETTGSIFNRQIRLAAPVVMSGACVDCHNGHPDSPKRDWAVGDVRGLQVITIEQPIATNLLSFKYLLLYFLIAGTIGITFAGLQWRTAKSFRTMNEELESANSFLASISMKIAKYLSPQVYKSIFSGEKDVII